MAVELNGVEEMQTEIAGQDDYDLNRVSFLLFNLIYQDFNQFYSVCRRKFVLVWHGLLQKRIRMLFPMI